MFSRLATPAATSKVGVISLGIGTLACYGRAGQQWTFYEINPDVERIARDPRLFTYLRDCPPAVDVVLGDARLSLSRASGPKLGVIVVDALNSDAIPVHLLRRQALAVYLDRLAVVASSWSTSPTPTSVGAASWETWPTVPASPPSDARTSR